MISASVTVVDAPDSDVQDAFWLRLRTFYASQLNEAWEDPNMRDPEKQAFVDAITDEGVLETTVNGSTVTTRLTRVDKIEEGDNSNARRCISPLDSSLLRCLHLSAPACMSRISSTPVLLSMSQGGCDFMQLQRFFCLTV
eukprot:GHVS01000609.1.p1 GENE.GHVS01000609.1~~GHVS01000609.1.p1  ORF type:complete len:140 (+),score=10.21 GHVS01000609.1:195-614(+)